MQLQKKRERDQEEIEIKKRKLADGLKVENMESKFSAHYDAVENDFKSSTVGLLTVEEMKTRQENAIKEREMHLARKNREELRALFLWHIGVQVFIVRIFGTRHHSSCVVLLKREGMESLCW